MSTASSNNKEGATPYVPQIKLDRSSPVPLYFQISEPIATLINDGTLPAGTRLEDELSMAARLQVSRPTARQALQRLVDRLAVGRARAAEEAHVAIAAHHHHVLHQHREVPVHLLVLRYVGHQVPADGGRNRLAQHLDGAGRRFQETHDGLEERGLAAAVDAYQGSDAAQGRAEAGVPQRRMAVVVGDGDPAHVQSGTARGVVIGRCWPQAGGIGSVLVQ
mgnify:CR=1 FL=1